MAANDLLAFVAIQENSASLVCCLQREVLVDDEPIECWQGWPFNTREQDVQFKRLWSIRFSGKCILDRPGSGNSPSVEDALLIFEKDKEEYTRLAFGESFKQFEQALEAGEPEPFKMKEQRFEFSERMQKVIFSSSKKHQVLYNSVHLLRQEFAAPFIDYFALEKSPAKYLTPGPKPTISSDSTAILDWVKENNMMQILS